MAEKIIIICGEPSGDLNAANLAKAIKGINPEVKIIAVGGTHLRNAGVEICYDIKGLSVIGFFDALKKLPKFFALKDFILKKIAQENPDAVIFVDFSGFNLRLAKSINNKVPTIYYISPQVWASRPGRVKTIRAYIRKLIAIFKFEIDFYKKYGIDADFVGHPLLDIVQPTMPPDEFLDKFGIKKDKNIIALLPGSRKQEVRRILPVMLGAASLINKDYAAQFLIAKSPEVNPDIYNNITAESNLDLKIIDGLTHDCLNASQFCLVASGTATLETAIMQKPLVVIYKMSLLNYLLYRPQVKVPYIGMVNIVAGKLIVPECVQFKATAENIAKAALNILKNPRELALMKENLTQIKSLLGEKGASLRAARIITDFLRKS